MRSLVSIEQQSPRRPCDIITIIIYTNNSITNTLIFSKHLEYLLNIFDAHLDASVIESQFTASPFISPLLCYLNVTIFSQFSQSELSGRMFVSLDLS